MTITTLVLDPRTSPEWEAFVNAHPEASVFHTTAWARVLTDAYGYEPRFVATHDDQGAIRAGVPMMLVKSRLAPRRLVGLPFSDMTTPLVSDDDFGRAAIEAAVADAKSKRARGIELRGPGALNVSTVGFTNGTVFLRHVIDLSGGTDGMRSRLHDSAKRAVRKAEREGITIREGKDLADMREFYRLTVLTRRKHGLLPQPWRFFAAIHRHLVQTGAAHVLLAEHGGKVIAGDLLLRFRDQFVYKFNASDPQHLQLRPNNLLLWHAMQLGFELGCATLDLGRCEVGNEGLRRFKLLWGSREEELSYYYRPGDAGRAVLTAGPARSALALFVKYAPVFALEAAGSMLYGSFG